ncbi:hypothetical protein [Microbulbifer spongiae]|uniref:Uncharacterized protein n=1 Tax=Microbulbifer spongiae TaxID=2944933 RepID=A0ABY9E5X8_9GAMM|nr:hypothetical protein [Microbulbifer sp. MI-G]WKD48428.1 hypothetical protein M8T91_10865 [Microbulbifer sp. MI-G]
MFVLSGDFTQSDPMDIRSLSVAYENYRKYLEENKSRFSDAAYQFAMEHWANDPNDHKALHDSWLEDFTIEERGINKDERCVNVTLKMLGAYHDGYIVVSYLGVTRYSFSHMGCHSGHGDYYRGEIRASEEDYGKAIHEIEWRSGDRWLIEFSDLSVSWSPRYLGSE